jgi:hypothetical protein
MSTLSDDTRTLAAEAYTYLYSLVTMEATRRQMTNTPAGSKPGMGAPDEFHHVRQFPPADFRAVVRPNFDTLYSSAWIDLTAGPVRISAPDTEDRYFMLPMLDMWTDVFANPGKRTTGTGARSYTLVGPGGAAGVEVDGPVIVAPTPWVWIIGRTQTNGPADYAAVAAVQDGFRIEPLTPRPEFHADPGADITTEPLRIVDGMSGAEFFAYASAPLAVNPPHATDHDVLARIARLGIAPGATFDPSRLAAGELEELEAGVADAKREIAGAVRRFATMANGWMLNTDTMGVYGNLYLKRAAVAQVGLGANPAEDAVYPLLATDADGAPVDGGKDYVIHFAADALPPVAAFWSITMYDAEGFQVANELDRFAIGDRDPLAYTADGSLDIYVQPENPGPDRVANWLPSAPGPSGITMRLYAPGTSALDGAWVPPPVRPAAS